MTFSAVYALLVGVLMIAQWTLTILKKQVAGPEEGPAGRGKIEMAFHWTAEFGCALVLIAAGIALLLQTTWSKPIFYVGSGMLVYSLINSPGFFAQQRKWTLVAMFALLLALAVVSLVMISR